MTRNPARNLTNPTAVRHLEEFGFTGWHLKRKKARPAAGEGAEGDDRLERRLAQADHHAAEGFPARANSAVFLMLGTPQPKAGDGLVALTRHWTVEAADVVHRDGAETIYAVLCV